MITDVQNSSTGRQEFIDLLCRMTNPENEMTTNNNTSEPDITIIDETKNIEEGEIITLDDDDEDGEITDKKEVEDGEITESDVCNYK